MTNDVVVSNLQVTKLTPAVIEAPNLDELVENTDKMLAKYREFPVSEESYDTAKQQRSVLNATVKDIADQRKKIEKELLGNWADIKPKMMLIEKAGKAASDLMKDQMLPVENERKERRKAVVMNDVTALANDQGVDWARIQFNEKWLNKTYSRNDMIKEIDAQIVQFKKDDELLALQTNQIEIEASGLGIDPTPYLSMLGLRDFADIKAQMHRDNEIKKARLADEQAHNEALAKAEQTRTENAKQVGDKLVDENGEVIQAPQPVVERTYDRTLYIIGATSKQLNGLADYMKANGIVFRGEK
ncbi:DUF1351 domain-containing protein [uncultured Leuconostoc sp.]|uniref:DUF1351 domain-containing protein n=1 Tax=uncultured Leuconostoc sp. TaxID=173262 RepID=UPI00280530DD|nr:DUF1351 domain-containing protein [uncultured Leuconostoc sp.]